ncbi:MAG TPA: LuxR C-terminal-related transcriptional regulator [Rhizomicrobium sp.]|nr:LuxR C-terminal-related transcriptional regulator [Rhizomicrobium sp.]
MVRTIAIWALVLAAGAFALDWLQYAYYVRMFPRDVYLGLVAAAFAAGGAWAGWRLAARGAPGPFARNDKAVSALSLTGQEMRVLEALAQGRSNKEIGRELGLSPNTVKTHAANLYAKLGARGRGEAVNRARELQILP